jgi:hypothetical protein
MRHFNKLLAVPIAALAIGGGVGIAAATNGSSDPGNLSPVADVKGPCDELEHATDPRCTGLQVPANEDDQGTTSDVQGEDQNDDNGQDANDPAEAEDQNDDLGEDADQQGEDADDQGEDANDDGLGENSGPSASSGPGSDGSGQGDDNSGSGHDGSEDGGSSGHGGGDD